MFFSMFSSYAQNWTPVGPNNWDSNSNVASIVSDTSYVYASGNFLIYNSLDTIKGIARWNGASWSALGNGFIYGCGALLTHQGKLYVAANLTSNISRPTVMKWDGSIWVPIGQSFNGPIEAFSFYGGELYVGGNFDSIGNIVAKNIAKWNGTNWIAVGLGTNNYINGMAIYSGELCVVGGFTVAGGIPSQYVAKWNGSNWSSIGSGISSGGEPIAANNNYLYVGAGLNGLIQWDGNNWQNILTNLNSITTIYCDTNSQVVYMGEFNSPFVYGWDNISVFNPCSPSSLMGNPLLSMTLYKNSLFVAESKSGSPIPVSLCPNPSLSEGISKLNQELYQIDIFPNPLIDKSCIHINPKNIYQISFYNIYGKKVKEITFNGELILNRTEFENAGVYFYSLEYNNIVYNGKLVVQ